MLSLSARFFNILVLTILSVSCSNSPPANVSSWSVQIKTSGGFAGIGKGKVLITSNGAIKFEAPHAPGKPFRSCEEKLPGKELQILGETVRQSRPDEWKIQGPNAAAPDAFEYELELRQGGKEQVYKVKWYDNTHDQLPDDLKKLSEAVNQAMEWAANKCR